MTYRNTSAESYAAGAEKVTDKVLNKASEIGARAGDGINRAIGDASAAVNTLSEKSRDAGDRLQQVAGNMKTAVDKSARDQPMATLAVAAAVGFVLGALWKS